MKQSTSQHRNPTLVLLASALGVGVVGNLMAQAPGGPGLFLFLFFASIGGAMAGVSRAAGAPLGREAWGWITLGLVLASAFVLRASTPLHVATFVAVALAFSLPALRRGRDWMRGSGVSEVLESVVGAAGWALVGALPTVLRSRGPVPPGGASQRRTAGGLVLGLLMAAPLLLVFGALFASADPVFADLLSGLTGSLVEAWASHLLVTGILAWLAMGFLTGLLRGTRIRQVAEGRVPAPRLGVLEVSVPLALVILLFAAFVAVQFRTLFGGASLVALTPGLTHAAHTREGFGQLAVASALVLPLLLLSEWLLRDASARALRLFRALGTVQLLLLGLVMASALQRVVAYQAAYGLTESRLYGTLFLGWLALTGATFGLTVLRGHRERFAFPALLAAFAMLLMAGLANPDAWIARANLKPNDLQMAATVPEAAETLTPASPAPSIDVLYLASLSADAVPTLLKALPHLPPGVQCPLARRLLERWGADADANANALHRPGEAVRASWRNWNLAVARARAQVDATAAELRRLAGPRGECPPTG